MNVILVIFTIFLLSHAQVVQLTNKFQPGKLNLKSDSGKYLTRCYQCAQGSYPDTVSVNGVDPSNFDAIWTVQNKEDQILFKSYTGQFLTRCRNCWPSGKYQDSAFIFGESIFTNPASLWTPEKKLNGKWAFKNDNGKYLARCPNCTQSTIDFAFVHSQSSDNPEAQWVVQYKFPAGKVTLKSDIGKYLTRCSTCASQQSLAGTDTGAVIGVDPRDPLAIWSVYFYGPIFGDKIALKSNNGKFLSRCRNCWKGGLLNQDSAFVNQSSFTNNPTTLWTPIKIREGVWALKGDNGKYLARCSNCVKLSTIEFAFVEETDVNQVRAHWNVELVQ